MNSGKRTKSVNKSKNSLGTEKNPKITGWIKKLNGLGDVKMKIVQS